jgi:phosphate transport system permease protein
MTAPNHTPDPARFVTSPLTLFVDRAMTWLIRAGGVGIIVAVFGIFLFIGWQVLPLFMSAQVEEASTATLPSGIRTDSIRGMISDEWGELPAVLTDDGRLTFLPQPIGARTTEAPSPSTVSLGLGGWSSGCASRRFRFHPR